MKLLVLNGRCGGRAPGLLPLLIEPPVPTCPAAPGPFDGTVQRLAGMVGGPDGPGLLHGLHPTALPYRLRRLMEMAAVWTAQMREAAHG